MGASGRRAAAFKRGAVSVTPTTWNPSDKSTLVSLSNANKTASFASTSSALGVRSLNAYKTSGKYYFEVRWDSKSGNGAPVIGFATSTWAIGTHNLTNSTQTVGLYVLSGNLHVAGVNAGATGTAVVGDIVGVAVDCDAKTVRYYKNGAALGSGSTSYSSITAGVCPALSNDQSDTSLGLTARFAAADLTYTPPAGFTAGWPQN